MSPVHEYEHCKLRIEQFEGAQGYENDWPRCSRCGALMDRLISAPAFHIKGHNAANGYAAPTPPRDTPPGRD